MATASADLHVRYTYPIAAYLKFCPGGIRYPHCLLNSTVEAASEAEAADASASSDLEKIFRSHSDERGEGELRHFYLFHFYSAETRRLLLVKYSSVGIFHGT